ESRDPRSVPQPRSRPLHHHHHPALRSGRRTRPPPIQIQVTPAPRSLPPSASPLPPSSRIRRRGVLIRPVRTRSHVPSRSVLADRLVAKSARLRQAKEEAEREITEYRKQLETEHQRKVAESSGDSGANVKRLEQETDAKIEQLKQQAASISPEVIQMLLRHVTTVKN
uniref:V-type proton ATPase subunit G n=1 Tax=Setaria italica TaxID=4555 RepID=K3ZZ42_SETIT